LYLPNFLQQGDRVGVLSPSGPQPQERLEAAIQSVRDFGLEPVVYDSCRLKHGYFAGTDRERAADLQSAFADPSVKGVICIRGGYGAHRLMEYVDLDAIAAARKPLYGYSDITALHIELNRRGVISWHTPMPGTEWYHGLDDFTQACVRSALFGPLPGSIVNPDGSAFTELVPGKAEGILCGGNLSLVASTIGTYYEIDTKGKILFLEDIDESPYRIDRMLLQLRHAGKFSDCAGVVFGPFTNCVAPEAPNSLTVDEVLDELLGDIGKPVAKGLQCGHVLPTACMPLGARAELDASEGTLKILE
jgi:muramoyltetrapeptide carboxypeptidase